MIGVGIGIRIAAGNKGFTPKKYNPIFWLKDLTTPVGGYWVDSSGNNKQIQAATTTVANDSLIMPANDSTIIAALTSAGCYSQFYTDNNTPKTVLISNVSCCYKDYSYYNYFDKKHFLLFASAQTSNRDKFLSYIDTSIFAFNSVQTTIPGNVNIIFQCVTNKYVYVDYGNWGNQAIQRVNATQTNHTLSSTGYQANTTYSIQIFTRKSDKALRKFAVENQGSFGGMNSSQLVGMPLTYLSISNSGSSHSFNSADFVGMPLTLYKLNLSGSNHIMNSSHFVGMPLTSFNISGTINTLSINTSHFTNMSLESFILYGAGTNVTGQISDLPASITTMYIKTVGNGISITSGTLKSWGSAGITCESLYSTSSVDNFLITWSTIAGSGTKTISLAGSNSACTTSNPTVAAAITTLQSKGKTIITN